MIYSKEEVKRDGFRTWLPAPKDSILPGFEAMFKAFENVGYIGELRQRWFEIKKLLKGGLPDIPLVGSARINC